MQYFIAQNGQQCGPMNKEELLNYGLSANTLVWHEGLPQWVEASNVPELMELLGQQQAQYQPAGGAVWHVMNNGVQSGPHTAAEVCSMGLNLDSLVWKDGMADWKPAYQMPEFCSYVPQYHQGETTEDIEELRESVSTGKATAGLIIGILCCINIPAIVLASISKNFASDVTDLIVQGKYKEARGKARASRTLGNISLIVAIVGAAISIIYFLAYFIAGASSHSYYY